MRRRSLTLQLTLLFAVSSSLVLVALGLVLGTLVHGHFEEQDSAELDGTLAFVSHVLAGTDVARDPGNVAQRLRDALVGRPGLAIAVAGPDGSVIYSSPGTTFPRAMLSTDPGTASDGGKPPQAAWRDDGREQRGAAATIASDASGRGPYRVAAAIDLSHHESFMVVYRGALWFSVLFAIVASVPLGWLAARRGIAPLREVTRLTTTVSASRLGGRIPEDGVPSELAELASSFNHMLERLEDSFRRLSEFSSDLAHEMRTPITNLMTQTQVALSRPRGTEEYGEVLYSNLEELDRLARLVEEMLFLAKSDHGLVPPESVPVDFAAQVDELLDFFEALASERGVRLERSGSAFGVGDLLMIRRALGNLLSNAIRHTASGGTVTVALSTATDGASRIAVENPGPDIPPRHLARLFDRFYRIDPARERTEGGAGLGLAITRAIVLAHGGSIDVRSSGGRTCFELTLPSSLTRL